VPAKPLVTITNQQNGDAATSNGASGDAEMQTPITPATPAPPQPINLGLEVVKDLVKAFQNHLDARRWRSVRFYVSSLPSLTRGDLSDPLLPYPLLPNSCTCSRI
jgi:hypothetical protein